MQVLVTGSAGRLGQILRSTWTNANDLGFDPIWAARHAKSANDCAWDILSGKPPFIAKGSVILHLAGILTGDKATLSANAAIAVAVCGMAERVGAKHLFVASSAAVYSPSAAVHFEDEVSVPATEYGRAKLQMEQVVQQWANQTDQGGPGVTCLRIGNVLGADALFGGSATRRIELDAIVGQPGGPIRPYIAPTAFSQVLAQLIRMAGAGFALPRVLNVAAPTAVRMADLLQAARRPYRIGQPKPHASPIVRISTQRLADLIPLPPTDVSAMIDDWRQAMAVTP